MEHPKLVFLLKPASTTCLIKCLTKSLLGFVCLWLAVGPLAILQLGAWTWMIASYSQDSSIEQAIQETFSDERPCQMCRIIDAVEEGQEDTTPLPEKKDQSLKLMLGLGRDVFVATPLRYTVAAMFGSWPYRLIGRSVPTPPPRSCA